MRINNEKFGERKRKYPFDGLWFSRLIYKNRFIFFTIPLLFDFLGHGPWGPWSGCQDLGRGPEKRIRKRTCSQGYCGEEISETKDCTSYGTG